MSDAKCPENTDAQRAMTNRDTPSKVAAVIRALWHTLRLGHSVRRDEMIYPGARTHVYYCSCGDSWGAPPGYRDGEYRGPHRF